MVGLTACVIGLGRMGSAIAYRLAKNGVHVFGYDINPENQRAAQAFGTQIVSTLQAAAESANIIWLMIPAGDIIDHTLQHLLPYLTAQHIVIDGGNSKSQDSERRAAWLAEYQVAFLDCGTSGGVDGKEYGFSLMVGGQPHDYQRALAYLEIIAAPGGTMLVGPSGAGHFVKTIHNGIEYAVLQAYAEGLTVIHQSRYAGINLAKVAKVWQNGSIMRGWINELCTQVLSKDQKLENISGKINENSTGQWALDEAEQAHTSFSMLKLALMTRAWSRESGGNWTTKLIALLRNRFGGHPLS